MTLNIFYQSASIYFNKDKKTFAFAVIIIKQLLNKRFSMNIKRSLVSTGYHDLRSTPTTLNLTSTI